MIIAEEGRAVMLESLAASMGAPNKTCFIAVLLDTRGEPMSEPAEFEGRVSLNSLRNALYFDFAGLSLKTTRAAICHVCRVQARDNAEAFVEFPARAKMRRHQMFFMPFSPRVSYDE